MWHRGRNGGSPPLFIEGTLQSSLFSSRRFLTWLRIQALKGQDVRFRVKSRLFRINTKYQILNSNRRYPRAWRGRSRLSWSSRGSANQKPAFSRSSIIIIIIDFLFYYSHVNLIYITHTCVMVLLRLLHYSQA